MSVEREIRTRLEKAFAPRLLEVRDDSERHRGHAGWRESGGTHFNVRMEAAAFKTMSRLGRHRAVHDALGRDLTARIHALTLQLSG